MELLQASVDRALIAIWLGHESVETTQVYLDANLALKEQILAKTRDAACPAVRHNPRARAYVSRSPFQRGAAPQRPRSLARAPGDRQAAWVRQKPSPLGRRRQTDQRLERARCMTALRLVRRPSEDFAFRTRAAPPRPSFFPA